MNSFEKILLSFLQDHCQSRPLLLGFSGGPDSTFLFHQLCALQYPFSVAHIDHGWRKESSAEALYLQNLAEEKKIPFFLKKLQEPLQTKNLEDICRQKRLDFFKETIQSEGFKGVILGHHADDQAETVLKRVFEGASLAKLRGLLPVSEIKGLKIFRPLLSLSKKEIISWLEEREIFYFQDNTNLDPRFLRARLRNSLLPTLSQTFGKEISSSLCRLGKSAGELSTFMEEILEPYRKKRVHADGKLTIDFQDLRPKSVFLWKEVVKDFFNSQGICLSMPVLETIVYHLERNTKNVHIRVEKRNVEIQRSILALHLTPSDLKNRVSAAPKPDSLDRLGLAEIE